MIKRSWLINLSVVFASSVIAFSVCEVSSRVFNKQLLPKEEQVVDDRQCFWSEGYVREDRNGALRATPNATIREVLVAGGKIEFDVTYKT
jgi:hypothetical protein